MKATLKRSEVRLLSIAITQLEGRREPVYDRDKNLVEVITKPFDFAPGVRYALAKTARKLQDEVDAVEAEIKAQRAKANGDAALVEEILQKWIMEKVEIEMHQIRAVDLRADENKLSPTTLSWLLPLLEE